MTKNFCFVFSFSIKQPFLRETFLIFSTTCTYTFVGLIWSSLLADFQPVYKMVRIRYWSVGHTYLYHQVYTVLLNGAFQIRWSWFDTGWGLTNSIKCTQFSLTGHSLSMGSGCGTVYTCQTRVWIQLDIFRSHHLCPSKLGYLLSTIFFIVSWSHVTQIYAA